MVLPNKSESGWGKKEGSESETGCQPASMELSSDIYAATRAASAREEGRVLVKGGKGGTCLPC